MSHLECKNCGWKTEELPVMVNSGLMEGDYCPECGIGLLEPLIDVGDVEPVEKRPAP